MEYKNFEAHSVEEAITKACLEFAVTSDKLAYEVVQEASNGFLGFGGKKAIIRASVKEETEEVKEPEAAEREEKPASGILTSDLIEKRAAMAAARNKSGASERDNKDQGERNERRDRNRSGRGGERRAAVKPERKEQEEKKEERIIKQRTPEEQEQLMKKASDFLQNIVSLMNVSCTVRTSYDQADGSMDCFFEGDDMGILIGKRGQTLDSLQYLTSLVVNKGEDDYTRVKLDTEDYRARREETLNTLAKNIAFKVKRVHHKVALEPMNPYERRIIHSALQNNRFVETYSEGEEPFRHVVVAPKR